MNLILVISTLLFICRPINSRTASSQADICSRLPTLDICPQTAVTDRQPLLRRITLTPTPAPFLVTAEPSFQTVATESPRRPLLSNLGGGLGLGKKITPALLQDPQQLRALCYQYKSLASTYCTGGPNELAFVKQRCDLYRQFCITDQTGPFDDPPCAPYESQYLTLCLQQQPVNDEIGRFCSSYRRSCTYGRDPQTLNPGFSPPIGRPLVAPGTSTVVDPYPAPWSSIYTFQQGPVSTRRNGPLPSQIMQLPPPWSSNGSPSLVPPAAGGAGGLSSITSPLAPLAALPPGGVPAFAPGGAAAGAGTGAGAGSGGAPLSVGSSANAPFAGVGSGANVNPLQGVGTGTSVNAAGLPISSGSNVNFGGLIPGLGRRKRRSYAFLLASLPDRRSIRY